MIKNEILDVLEDLLNYEDIYACMLIRKGMDGVTPTTDKFKGDVLDAWEILQKTMDDVFSIIQQYLDYGMKEIYFNMMNYEVMFFVIPGSDTALVVMIPNFANKRIVEITVESARNKIVEILK